MLVAQTRKFCRQSLSADRVCRVADTFSPCSLKFPTSYQNPVLVRNEVVSLNVMTEQ